MRTYWNEAMVEREVLAESTRLGRMPNCDELQRLGRNDLANQIGKRGGFRHWATRLGLRQSGGTSHRAMVVEDHVQQVMVSRGHSVERMSWQSPFDLLVDSVLRVDVKGGLFHSYTVPKGGVVAGYFFGLHKVPPTCDLYALCCLSDTDEVGDVYWIPSSEAAVQTVTITPRGKYSAFKNTISQVDWLLGEG